MLQQRNNAEGQLKHVNIPNINADANNNNEPISIADTKMIEAFGVAKLRWNSKK